MRRRLLTTLLTLSAGVALLTSISAIVLWALWLGWQQQNLRANRTAAVFVNSTDEATVVETLAKVQTVPLVDDARAVSVEEFTDYLKQHFPDLADALQGLGVDVIPRMLEVTLAATEDASARQDALRQLSLVPNVLRVDDGLERISKALSSLKWLSWSGLILSAALWCVLLIICLGHYQGILFTEIQEIQLMRSLGATKLWLLAPWFVEAAVHGLICTGFVLAGVLFGKNLLADLFNQFFGTFGYEPFVVSAAVVLPLAAAVFLGAILAHGSGAFLALARGRLR